ncbi:fasciclin domain-containing protein [Sphingobacterium alimentarium]|nr:fasciclin domain-containing protein [Sphingobacterium alimentarium]
MMLACSDDDDNNMIPNKTIVDVVVESSDFSTLESAVQKANLASTLSGNGPFTVFAPDNESFTASGVTSSVIESLSAACEFLSISNFSNANFLVFNPRMRESTRLHVSKLPIL